MGDIACECGIHNGLHVCMPTHHVEILRTDGSVCGPGELGEIIVTSLINYAMPLIRYRIGDMGMWAKVPCSCGRNWPLLKRISGRVTDVFTKKDGGIVSPEYLIHLIGVELNSGWVRKYQVVQEAHENLRVLIQPMKSVSDPNCYYKKETENISNKIRLAMGHDCRIDYEFVKSIAPTASGKYRYTISKVAR
jgi:phenylacetate-CoA ligase